MSEMTEERLAELQSTRDKARSWAGLPGEVDDVFTDLADAVDEIDRLRAENARLRETLDAYRTLRIHPGGRPEVTE